MTELDQLELDLARVYFDPMLRGGLELSINNKLRHSKCSVFIQKSLPDAKHGVSLVINLDVDKVTEIENHRAMIKHSQERLRELGYEQ